MAALCRDAATAQTPPAPPPTLPANSGSFFETAQNYFTSFNTNLDSTFALERGEFWTSVDSIQGAGVPLTDGLGISYNVWKQISAESITRIAGVQGGIVSQSVGLGLSFIVHDAKITLYADGVYLMNQRPGETKACAEIGLHVKKALSEHTFAFIGIGAQLPKNSQIFSAGAGFTF